MKTSLTLLGIGAGLLVGLTSCQSSSSATGGYEEAMPMSELAIADGELPPWVLESGDTEQIPAGESTAAARNNYAIPEPEEKGASQKQPDNVAVAPPTDDTVIENDFTEPAKPVITHTAVTPTVTHEPVVSTGKPKASGTSKPKTAVASNKGGKNVKKPVRVKEPTLVVYKVRPGDNLSDIAKRSGTTVAQIRKDSNIKGDIIHPGQTIKVRFTPKDYVAPKNAKNAKNGKGASAPAPAAKSTGYTVKAGDTISGIAKKNGISTSALLAANGMKPADAAKLRAGRKLTIPGKAAPATAAPAKSSKPAAKKAVKKSSAKKSSKKK